MYTLVKWGDWLLVCLMLSPPPPSPLPPPFNLFLFHFGEDTQFERGEEDENID